MAREELVIEGMHCGSCAMNIDEELEELEGVSEAKTSYRKQTTDVIFDETRTNVEAIQRTIQALGYEAARR